MHQSGRGEDLRRRRRRRFVGHFIAVAIRWPDGWTSQSRAHRRVSAGAIARRVGWQGHDAIGPRRRRGRFTNVGAVAAHRCRLTRAVLSDRHPCRARHASWGQGQAAVPLQLAAAADGRQGLESTAEEGRRLGYRVRGIAAIPGCALRGRRLLDVAGEARRRADQAGGRRAHPVILAVAKVVGVARVVAAVIHGALHRLNDRAPHRRGRARAILFDGDARVACHAVGGHAAAASAHGPRIGRWRRWGRGSIEGALRSLRRASRRRGHTGRQIHVDATRGAALARLPLAPDVRAIVASVLGCANRRRNWTRVGSTEAMEVGDAAVGCAVGSTPALSSASVCDALVAVPELAAFLVRHRRGAHGPRGRRRGRAANDATAATYTGRWPLRAVRVDAQACRACQALRTEAHAAVDRPAAWGGRRGLDCHIAEVDRRRRSATDGRTPAIVATGAVVAPRGGSDTAARTNELGATHNRRARQSIVVIIVVTRTAMGGFGVAAV